MRSCPLMTSRKFWFSEISDPPPLTDTPFSTKALVLSSQNPWPLTPMALTSFRTPPYKQVNLTVYLVELGHFLFVDAPSQWSQVVLKLSQLVHSEHNAGDILLLKQPTNCNLVEDKIECYSFCSYNFLNFILVLMLVNYHSWPVGL